LDFNTRKEKKRDGRESCQLIFCCTQRKRGSWPPFLRIVRGGGGEEVSLEDSLTEEKEEKKGGEGGGYILLARRREKKAEQPVGAAVPSEKKGCFICPCMEKGKEGPWTEEGEAAEGAACSRSPSYPRRNRSPSIPPGPRGRKGGGQSIPIFKKKQKKKKEKGGRKSNVLILGSTRDSVITKKQMCSPPLLRGEKKKEEAGGNLASRETAFARKGKKKVKILSKTCWYLVPYWKRGTFSNPIE